MGKYLVQGRTSSTLIRPASENSLRGISFALFLNRSEHTQYYISASRVDFDYRDYLAYGGRLPKQADVVGNWYLVCPLHPGTVLIFGLFLEFFSQRLPCLHLHSLGCRIDRTYDSNVLRAQILGRC